MRRVNPETIAHESSNKSIIDLMENVNVKFVVKLDDALEKRGLTQQWLATTTGLRQAAISDFVKGNKTALNKIHLIAIMNILRISDIRELIDIEFEPATIEQFTLESEKWIKDGIIPQEIQALHEQNSKK